MGKLLDRPVQVQAVNGLPVRFRAGASWRRITAVCDQWRETGRWWESEVEKEFYEVEAGGRYILVRENGTPHWRLYQVED